MCETVFFSLHFAVVLGGLPPVCGGVFITPHTVRVGARTFPPVRVIYNIVVPGGNVPDSRDHGFRNIPTTLNFR